MTVTSPCTGVCKLDEATGWCLGCGRNGDEIADWRSYSETSRGQVWDQIPDRLKHMGVACRRLRWTADEIASFVVQTLEQGQGTWVMGVVGAVAEFTAPYGAKIAVVVQDHNLVARTQNGAMRMKLGDDIRALTFDPPGLDRAPRIVLAVKRERGRLPVADGVTDVGEDTNALLGECGTRLFDLGLSRKEARFCLRLGDSPARTALENAARLSFLQALPQIGPTLVAESPTRVIETALGRVEVQGKIPPPDARSPDGPHTHLLPDHLATNRSLPVGMELPRAYLPGAIFYPTI